MRVFPLRIKILTILIVFPALIGTAFVIYSIITTENFKRMRLENIVKTVEYETESVNTKIAEIERAAILYALAGLISFEAQSDVSGEKLAVGFTNSFPLIVGGGFWFAPFAYRNDQLRAGFYAFYDEEAGKVRLDDTFFMDEYDYHNMNWYKEIIGDAKQPYQVVWTKPYIDDSGSYSLMTTAGSVIFGESGDPVALSTIDWEIDKVIETLSAIRPTEGSFVLLCVPEKDYVITNTLTRSSGGAVKEISWDLNADSFDMNGKKYLVFSRVMNNGWFLSVQIPSDEIFAEIESKNRLFSIITAFSIVLMLCVAFYLISKLLNVPLKRLTDKVSQLDLGNLDVHIEVTTKDELGLLAQTFNKMTADLKASIEAYGHERAEKERINSDLRIATDIQADMLPKIFPPYADRDDLHIAAFMQPAKEVGGDFYDFFFLDDAHSKIALVIADVSGKGVPAALFMVIAKVLIKNNMDLAPDDLLRAVNNLLCADNNSSMFVTSYYSVLDIATGRYTYASAGHNPVVLYRKETQSVSYIDVPKAPPLAAFPNRKYVSQEFVLQSGDALLLYTDGVTEAFNSHSEMYGTERLLEDVSKLAEEPADAVVNGLYKSVEEFAGGEPQSDDITMLFCKYIGIPSRP